MPPALRNALVWCLLVLVPAGWIALSAWEAEERQQSLSESAAAPESVGPMTTLQGKLLAGFGAAGLQNPDPLGTRPMARLCAAMILARAGDRERAEAQWTLAGQGDGAVDAPLHAAVGTLVKDWPQAEGERGQRTPHPGVLDDGGWKLVQERLGWFGALARADFTAEPAAQEQAYGGEASLTITLLSAGMWFLAVGLLGLGALVVLLVLAIKGSIRSGIQAMPRTQSILGETFVAWMLLFLGGHVLLGRLGGDGEPSAQRLWLGLVAAVASLAALGWAIVRGLSWRDLREAAGLHFRGGPLRLAWMSGVSYACALPCMGADILLGMWLAQLLGDRSFQDVSHPVQEMLPGASPSLKVALFVLASVSAPVVEEIAFRGLLYGHARQQSAGWPKALSVALAMLFSATVFAAIHPQGVLAVPALAGVSLGFCITREWSGSVVPGMVAHGVHNGLLLALNLALQA